MKMPSYPPKSLDPFYVYYTYCHQDIVLYNKVALKYNIVRLPQSYIGSEYVPKHKSRGKSHKRCR